MNVLARCPECGKIRERKAYTPEEKWTARLRGGFVSSHCVGTCLAVKAQRHPEIYGVIR